MSHVRIVGVLLGLGLAAAATGCKAADALATREVIVHFAPGSPESAHVEVQQTCGVVPHVSPEPIPPESRGGPSLTDVSFLVKPGTDSNLKALFDCIGQPRFRGVVLGYDAPDM